MSDTHTAETLKNVPLRHVHEALGAKMVPFAGYLMPVRYTSDLDEHHCVRNRVGMFDVSHMGEFRVTGPNALALVQFVTTNDVSKLSAGQAQYSILTRPDGTAVDDLLVYCLGPDEYLLVVNAGNIDKDFAWISGQNTIGATLVDESADWCLFAVQGPMAQAVLQTLTETDLSTIPYYQFRLGALAGHNGVILSATGYTGSGGFEVYVPNAVAEHVWNAILVAGASVGIQPIGLGARDTLRLEMGYALYGHELDDETTPLEAGLGWVTKLSKSDFSGKAALEAQKAAGYTKKLTGFVVEGKGGIPRAGYAIVDQAGSTVGIVTSGTLSPTYGIGLGMAFVEPAALAGGNLSLKVRERVFPIQISKLPPVVQG
jgi:aminomethyltransferase